MYAGELANGKLHGKGTYVSPNGEQSEGEWCEGKRIRWLDE